MSDSGSSSTLPLKNPKLSAMSKAFAAVDLDGHDLPPSPAPSSPRGSRNYAIATQLVYSEGNDQYNASSVPIYQVRCIPIVYTSLDYRLTYSLSLQPSNKNPRPVATPSTITPAAAILHEPT